MQNNSFHVILPLQYYRTFVCEVYYTRTFVLCKEGKAKKFLITLINDVKRVRGNPPPFRPNQFTPKYITRNIHVIIFSPVKNGPPPYPPRRTGMINFALINTIKNYNCQRAQNIPLSICNLPLRKASLLPSLPQASHKSLQHLQVATDSSPFLFQQ